MMTITHNDKAKRGFLNILQKKRLKYLHKYSDLLLSTLLKNFWVWCFKLGTPVFGEFLPFFSADPLKLCQVGWGALLHSYFKVSPEMFNQVQDRALAGPLKGIQRLVPKPLLRCLGCVLRVIVLLEGEPSPQSEFLITLEQVFIKDISVLCSSSFPQSWLVSQSLPLKNIPTAWCCHHHVSL